MTLEKEFEAITGVRWFREYLRFTESRGFVFHDPTDLLTAWEMLFDQRPVPYPIVQHFYGHIAQSSND